MAVFASLRIIAVAIEGGPRCSWCGCSMPGRGRCCCSCCSEALGPLFPCCCAQMPAAAAAVFIVPVVLRWRPALCCCIEPPMGLCCETLRVGEAVRGRGAGLLSVRMCCAVLRYYSASAIQRKCDTYRIHLVVVRCCQACQNCQTCRVGGSGLAVQGTAWHVGSVPTGFGYQGSLLPAATN